MKTPRKRAKTNYSHHSKKVRKVRIGDYGLSLLNVSSFLALGVVVLLGVAVFTSAFDYARLLRGKNRVAAAESVVVPKQLTFSDDFNNGKMSGWRSIDEAQSKASSEWLVTGSGELQQTKNIFSGDAARAAINKPGTYLLNGNENWTNYEYSVRVKSTDDDAIGVMFRFQGKNNYYRFSMDKQRGYQRLVKNVNGTFTTLAENAQSYNLGQWYTLKVRAIGSNIQVFVDDRLTFNVTDSQFPSGKIALYNWGQKSAFYDDVKVHASVDSFSIAVLPDTQYYSQYYPEIFAKQTEWIAAQRAQNNIAFVLHEGDITNKDTAPEWRSALNSMKVLDGKLPYAIIPGNHDNKSSLFNQYFPVSRYNNLPTFGGTQTTNQLDNNYHLFSAGGVDWLVIGLDWAPGDDSLAWANSVAASYPNRRTIVLTHAYLAGDNTLYGSSPNHDQVPTPPKNSGVGIWNKLVKRQPNIQFVFSGHVVSPDGFGRLTSVGDRGNKVYQMLANYQSYGSRPGQIGVNGGNGYLRLVTFYPGRDTVEVKTYSPYLNTYLTDNQNQFTLTGVQL